jgi:hypothetical protein
MPAHSIALTLTGSTVLANPKILSVAPPGIQRDDTVKFDFVGIAGREIEVVFERVNSLVTGLSLPNSSPAGPFQGTLPSTSGSSSGSITGTVAASRVGRFFYNVFATTAGQRTLLQWIPESPVNFGGIDIPGPPSQLVPVVPQDVAVASSPEPEEE